MLDAEARFDKHWSLRSLVRGGEVVPTWMPDNAFFFYATGGPHDIEVWKVDPASGERTPLFDVADLRARLTEITGYEPAGRGVPTKMIAPIGPGVVCLTIDMKMYDVTLKTGEVTAVPPHQQAERMRMAPQSIAVKNWPTAVPPPMEAPSPDMQRFATVLDHQLAIRSVASGDTVPLTEDGEPDYAWEVGGGFGSGTGLWSPDGRLLIAFKTDKRRVFKLPLPRWLDRKPFVEYLPMPLTGDRMPVAEVHLVDTSTGETRRLDLGDEEQFVLPVGFTRDAAEILFIRLHLYARWLELVAVDVASGERRTIIREESDTRVASPFEFTFKRFTFPGTDPEHPEINPKPDCRIVPLKESDRFLWLTEQSGWRHIHLYDLAGEHLVQLTDGEWPVSHVAAVDEADGLVYFEAGIDADRAYDSHICRVPLDGGEIERLSDGPGLHIGQFSTDAKCFVEIHNGVTVPPRSVLKAGDGSVLAELDEADLQILDQVGWTEPEEFRVPTPDGDDEFYGVLYKPADFDPSKRYPVLELVYQGDYLTTLPRDFWGSMYLAFYHSLAQLGYVVVRTETRGCSGRGKAWQDWAYDPGIGAHEAADHRHVIERAAEDRPWMDLSKGIGVFGQSYGGYYTIRFMLQEPEFYTVGVALAPAELGYVNGQGLNETYLGPIVERKAFYDQAALVPLAPNLAGKLLIVAGSNDINCPFHMPMKLMDAFFRAGKHPDLLVLANRDHSFLWSGETDVPKYVRDRMRMYFDAFFKA